VRIKAKKYPSTEASAVTERARFIELTRISRKLSVVNMSVKKVSVNSPSTHTARERIDPRG
jgi:hypothetical protein